MARGPFTGQGTDTTGITLAFRRIIHQSAGGAAPVRQERFLTTAAAFVQNSPAPQANPNILLSRHKW